MHTCMSQRFQGKKVALHKLYKELRIVMGLSCTVTIMTVQSYVKVFKLITIILVIQLTIYIAIYYICNSGLDMTSRLANVTIV